MKSEFYQSTRKPISFDSNADTSKLISFAENDLLSLADAVIPKEIFSAPGNKNDRLKKIAALIHKNDKSKGLVGIILHDKNGKQVIANKIAERLYNGSKAETINHLWKTGEVLSNNKSVPLENSPFMQALHTGRSQRRSFRILLKNGEQRWLFFHSKPLLEKGETHASGVVSSVIDITNEKQLAHYIEDRNDLVLSFMKETPNPAWIVDEDGRLIFATAAFFSYFNLKEKETIGKNLAELVPPQLYHSLYAKHLKVLNCGKSLKTVEQIKLANGSSFTSYVNLFLIKNGEQKLVAGHSVYLGKSSRIKARQRETKENMLLLSHASSDAIWEWDIMTGRIYQNKALMNLLGYKSTHFSSLSWWLRHIHPDDMSCIKNKIKEAAQKCEPSWKEQYRFRCADGTYKYIQDRGYVIYENDLPVRMIGSLTDISQIKKLKDQLTNEKIRSHIEISETALRVQEMERTKIGQELHDNVNQILSTARLFVDITHPVTEKDQQAREKSLEYISLAIEEIRKLSKELAAPQLKEKGLADNIKIMIDDIHLASPIRFKLTYDHDLKLLSASKKIVLFRIVQEQVKNILKHSEAKTAGISFSVKNGEVILEIWDDGKGFIPQQTHQGIGLSNMRERVMMYDGKVDIDARPGKGCRLHVTLPVN